MPGTCSTVGADWRVVAAGWASVLEGGSRMHTIALRARGLRDRDPYGVVRLVDQGEANAQVFLGIMFAREGRGRDKANAKWFHMPDDQGLARASRATTYTSSAMGARTMGSCNWDQCSPEKGIGAPYRMGTCTRRPGVEQISGSGEGVPQSPHQHPSLIRNFDLGHVSEGPGLAQD